MECEYKTQKHRVLFDLPSFFSPSQKTPYLPTYLPYYLPTHLPARPYLPTHPPIHLPERVDPPTARYRSLAMSVILIETPYPLCFHLFHTPSERVEGRTSNL